MLRPIALLALVVFASSAHAVTGACESVPSSEAAACEQKRAETALDTLSNRYARIWAQLSAQRRNEFAAAERRWLNGGRWDDHAACVAAHTGAAAADVVGARCLADVTVAHIQFLDGASGMRVATPHN
jgi:hypothetical protein